MGHGHGCQHITETCYIQIFKVNKNMDEYVIVGTTGHRVGDEKTESECQYQRNTDSVLGEIDQDSVSTTHSW